MAGLSSKALAFGEPKNKKGYAGNEIQNKEFSDGSGLEVYDFNARTYDQQIGRFIQMDPLSEEDDQEDWSPYHYSYNNPVTFSDPDGKIPIIPIIWAIVAALSSDAAVTATVVATTTILTGTAVYDAAANASTEPIGKGNTGEGTYVVGSPFTMGASSSNRITSSTRTPEPTQLASGAKTGALGKATAGLAKGGKYGHLKEPRNIGPGNKTTSAQRKRVLEENKKQNNGQLTSDGDGRPLNPPKKLKKGDKEDPNSAQVDHINPANPRNKSKPQGSNSNVNLQVLSAEENKKKSNN